MLLSNSVSGIEQIKYEAASILARIHIEQVLCTLYLLLLFSGCGHSVARVTPTMQRW